MEKALTIILELVKVDKITIENAIVLIEELYKTKINFTVPSKKEDETYINTPYDPFANRVWCNTNACKTTDVQS